MADLVDLGIVTAVIMIAWSAGGLRAREDSADRIARLERTNALLHQALKRAEVDAEIAASGQAAVYQLDRFRDEARAEMLDFRGTVR